MERLLVAAGRQHSRRQFVRAMACLGLCFGGSTLLSGCGIAAPVAPPKVHRIGYLWSKSAAAHLVEAFRQGLRELGYAEGQNIAIEWRHAEGKEDRIPDFASELVGLNVDVLVVAGSQAISAAKQATSTIPIVMAHSSDAVGAGFVSSLARPGGNITGTTEKSPLVAGKRLQLLKEASPGTSRVAVLWEPSDQPRVVEFAETQVAAQTLGVQLQSLVVRGPNDFESAFKAASSERAQALVIFANALTISHRTRIVELAGHSRLPAMYGLKEFVDAGGLMSYAPNIADFFRRAAYYVDRILKGTKPGDLPVEQPTKFDFAINLKAAQAFGLTIQQSVLAQATDIIQ